MPPRTLLSVITLGAVATLAHPLAQFMRRRARSKVDAAQWTLELLKQLEWRRFEELCVAYFEACGYRTQVCASAAGTGVDISLLEQGAERPSTLVQCQPWNAYRVGIKPVRELLAAMVSANVARAMLVTSGKFTPEARDFARKETTITLVDGAGLLARFAELAPEKTSGLLRFATQGDFSTPTCPSCDLKMIPRKSTTHGRKFWGCRNYPGCKQTFSNTL